MQLLSQIVKASMPQGAFDEAQFVENMAGTMNRLGLVFAKKEEPAVEEQPDGSRIALSPEEQGVCGCRVRLFAAPVVKE